MEIRVVQDLAEAAVEAFVEAAPRTVALSGGMTPRQVYGRLAKLDYPWAEVDVFFSDERCVPPDHPDSNFRMASETLLSLVPARVHAMTSCDADSYEAELANVFGPGIPRFDLMFLGLGEDGHIASLFPGDSALAITDRNVAMVEGRDHRRMTLTLPVLSAARFAVFLVTGETKRKALSQLLGGDDIPAARVAADRVVVLADHAAAGV